MLIGQYHTKVSSKGRVPVPAKFRRELGEVVVVTRWFEGSLALFSKSSWDIDQKGILKGAMITSALRATERFLFGGAYEVELDEQGRFVVPQMLREYGSFGAEVVFVGVREKVEVWDRERWEEIEQKITKGAEELMEQLQKERRQ